MRPRARRSGRGAGFAVANLITLFAPPKVIISGRAMAMSGHFIDPLRKTVAALLPASLADVSDIVVREWSDADLGARRGSHDVARSLRRAVGNDGAGADSRSAGGASRRIVMKPVGIGVIGCGNISSAYLTAAKAFPILDVVALSDASPAAAEARAAEFGVPARPVDALLADPAVEIVLNLTVPKSHVEVGLKALAAGKHVHSEKPLGVNVAEARQLIEAGGAKGCGSAARPTRFSAAHTRPRAAASTRG